MESIAEADSGRSTGPTVVEQVRERLAELWSYLTANQTRLINYGREYREGPHIDGADGIDLLAWDNVD
jgi:hypothetical protein